MKIGFIGLGNLGMPMALNLHKSKRIDELYKLNDDEFNKQQELGVSKRLGNWCSVNSTWVRVQDLLVLDYVIQDT